jgi:hypothetical protein
MNKSRVGRLPAAACAEQFIYVLRTNEVQQRKFYHLDR